MKKKELIIQLIKQDLKHYQLVQGIERLGFQDERKNDLRIYETILSIIPIKDAAFEEHFTIAYEEYLTQASQLTIQQDMEALTPIAEKCYQLLESFKELEKTKPD